MDSRDCVVMTGAARGLGKAVCERLCALGVPVIAIVRRPCDTGHAVQLRADLSQPHDWQGQLPPMLSHLSFLRLWFLDIAAVLPQGSSLAPDHLARLEEALRVNVTAPLAIARTLAELARASGASLNIVHVSSGAAHRPIAGWSAYCTTKAAAAMQWQALAEEDEDISVQLFQPGVIDTAMQAQLREAGDPSAAPETALRSPQAVAARLLSECGLVP